MCSWIWQEVTDVELDLLADISNILIKTYFKTLNSRRLAPLSEGRMRRLPLCVFTHQVRVPTLHPIRECKDRGRTRRECLARCERWMLHLWFRPLDPKP